MTIKQEIVLFALFVGIILATASILPMAFAYSTQTHEDGTSCLGQCPVFADEATVTLNDDDNIFYTNDEIQIIRGLVTVYDYTPTDGDINLSITHLSSGEIMLDSKMILRPSGDNHISPFTYIINGIHTQVGEFKVILSSEHIVYETFSFFILHPEMEVPEESPKVPYWVKEIAGWYAEGTISEIEFLDAIKYLVNNKIIDLYSN